MTELKTFVSETIQQIIEGSKHAGDYIKENLDYEKVGFVQIGSNSIHYIEFDISVSTTESTKTEGKAGIMIKVIDFGVKGTDNMEATSMNRIRFKVPVVFPQTNNSKE